MFISALIVSLTCMAAPPDAPADLTPVLAPIREKFEMPGLIAAVVEGDRITAIGAVGVRKIDSPELMTTGDLIHLGSDTKAMTATLIGLLIERGKIDWNTPLEKIFPELAKGMHADFRKVTVHQLLTHRAGLVANFPAVGLAGATLTQQRHRLVEKATAMPPLHPPGSKFLYSNTGYAILGAIAEKITGKPYDQLMVQEIFKPLGMTTVGYGPPGARGKVDQPWGHSPMPIVGKLVSSQADNPAVIGPAGTAHCTISDWAKFISLHLKGHRVEPTPILQPETFKKLHAPFSEDGDYACGWSALKRPWAGNNGPGVALTHSGSNTMWFCTAWLAPEKNFALLVATNRAGGNTPQGVDQAVGKLMEFMRTRKLD